MRYKLFLILIFLVLIFPIKGYSEESKKFYVPSNSGDAGRLIKETLEKISALDGKPAVIELSAADYHLNRENSTSIVYHMSNTTSEKENPDPHKHVGILIKKIRNLKINGNGARFVIHGEMTPFVIDSCENIELENFSLTAFDPTVTEIKILEVSDTSYTFQTLPLTNYEINHGVFQFVGEGWSFGDPTSGRSAWAQVYYPDKNVTKRCSVSPLNGYKRATEIKNNIVRLDFDKVPQVEPGEIYQFRHLIRNEAGGFINMSKDISFKDINFNYLGNFGLLSQYSENIYISNIKCSPDENSERTNAGFADFLHFSGCRGLIKIYDSYFCGSQDDGINVHGTYLKIIERETDKKFKVKFMHPQTFGFTPFFKGDEVEIVNVSTLNKVHNAKVTNVESIDDYNFLLEIDTSLPKCFDCDGLVIENVSFTPEVEIRGNVFERIPTRGILLTTRKKSIIENNTFFRMPMAAILVADDASGWYESGPVFNLTIRGNTFIECAVPNIMIKPEIKRFDKPVHRGIRIENNKFYNDSTNLISIQGAKDVIIKNNSYFSPDSL